MDRKQSDNSMRQDDGRLVPDYDSDRITLVDLWRILAARRWLIVAVFVACLILGGLVTYLTKPVYVSHAVITIGRVASVGPLEASGDLVQRVQAQYAGGDSLPRLVSVSASNSSSDGAGDVITLAARGASPRQASQYLSGVTTDILRDHRRRFDEVTGKLQERLDSLQQQSDTLHQTIAAIDGRLQGLSNDNAAMGATLAVEKASLLQQLPTLGWQINNLQIMLSPVRTVPTKLVRRPTVPVKPVRPKPLLYMVLAAVLGLVLGVFSAFVAEFAAAVRARGGTPGMPM